MSAYVMRISPVGFQRMRELKKCHKQDIFLTERKIPFARDPSLREKVIAFHTLFRELTREKVVRMRDDPTFVQGRGVS